MAEFDKLEPFEFLVGRPAERAFRLLDLMGLAEESAFLQAELVASAIRCDIPPSRLKEHRGLLLNAIPQFSRTLWQPLYANEQLGVRSAYSPFLLPFTAILADTLVQGATGVGDPVLIPLLTDAWERNDLNSCYSITSNYAARLAEAGRWYHAAAIAAGSVIFDMPFAPSAFGILERARDALPPRPVVRIGDEGDLALAAAGAAFLGDESSAQDFYLIHAAMSRNWADLDRFVARLDHSSYRDLARFSRDFAHRGYFALSAQLAASGLALLVEGSSEMDEIQRMLVARALHETGKRREFELLIRRSAVSQPDVTTRGDDIHVTGREQAPDLTTVGPSADTTESPPAAHAKARLGRIERTPHLKLLSDSPLRPGTAVDLAVYVDKLAPRPEEKIDKLVIDAAGEVEVRLIATKHFVVVGTCTGSIHIARDQEKSEEARFRLKVVPPSELPVNRVPVLVALFFHNGRPCGKVSREVEIQGYRVDVRPPKAPSPPPEPLSPEAPPELSPSPPVPPTPNVQIEVGATAADLSVTITKIDNTGLNFICTVRTPLLSGYAKGQDQEWSFEQKTDQIVRGYMSQFVKKKGARAIIAELRGAGIRFFEKAPQVFKDAFWELIDSKLPFETISVVSQEPFIPWELMIPVRDNGEQRAALGVEFRLARWTDRKNVAAPPQRILLADSLVVAPQYDDKRKALKTAEDEKNLVLATFKGEAIVPAKFAEVEKGLQSDLRSLVHFVCHGADDPSGIQTIELEDDKLSSNGLLGMHGVPAAFANKHPFVFLNACEVGRLTPALVGLGGFADAFIQIGASAVLAALWSVDDAAAHEVARTFYARVKAEPNLPFAQILRDIRRLAYQSNEAKDTYAAYCFYGDPAARAVSWA